MKRLQRWSKQKKTGAVKKRIMQECRIFLDSLNNSTNDTNKSLSYDDIRLDSGIPVITENKEDSLQREYITKYTSNFGQVRVEAQQGSVEQEQEKAQVNNNFFDSIPLSASEDEEEEEEKFSDIEKITALTKQLKTWSVGNNITQTALKQLLLILNEGYVSTTLLLPKDPRTVLRTPKEICIKNIEGGQYWHHGITEPLMKLLKDFTPIPNSIHLIFNFDGLPIFKSAKKEFWPILANAEGNVFTIGIYYGTGKPKILEEYLEDFVTEMKSLLSNGIIIDEKLVSIKIKCFVCDSPARAFLKGVCNFNGRHGCLKCTTVGEYSHTSHTVVFSTKEDSPRTDENFRAKLYGETKYMFAFTIFSEINTLYVNYEKINEENIIYPS
ncbi:unnamed protein product [Parnassius apollo]|uniref:(apollo) hypothetical protein n=1 Tax=Parnassius apollo TaxID=110799 RepID=A0A8S3XUD5_PARAO|nr:unnamed protein product [Parnassius apollo]